MATNLKQIGENCMFVQRPFGKVLDDSQPCKKLGKFVNFNDGESCQSFMPFDEEKWRLMIIGM